MDLRPPGRWGAVEIFRESTPALGMGLRATVRIEAGTNVVAYPIDSVQFDNGPRRVTGIEGATMPGYSCTVAIARQVNADDEETLAPLMTGTGDVANPFRRHVAQPHMLGHLINDPGRPGMTRVQYQRAIRTDANVVVDATTPGYGAQRAWVLYKADGPRNALYTPEDAANGVQAFGIVVALRDIAPGEPLRMPYGPGFWER